MKPPPAWTTYDTFSEDIMATNRLVAYIMQRVVEVQSIDFPKMVDATNGKQIDL